MARIRDRNACGQGGEKIQNENLFQIFTISQGSEESKLNFLQPVFDGIINNEVLKDHQKELVFEMIERRRDCFSKDKSDLGYCPFVKHEIDVKSDIRPQQTYHRLPLGLEERVELEIEELLKKVSLESRIFCGTHQ